jgi:hypothetical protein
MLVDISDNRHDQIEPKTKHNNLTLPPKDNLACQISEHHTTHADN